MKEQHTLRGLSDGEKPFCELRLINWQTRGKNDGANGLNIGLLSEFESEQQPFTSIVVRRKP